MAGIVQRYRLSRARKRWMPSPSAGPGPLTVIVLLAVVGIVVWVAGLDRRERERAARRVELARAGAMEAVAFVTGAARTRRVVLLGDVLGADGPKRLAADLIEALARGPGLDVVALEIDVDVQSRIDAYLEARDEDASLLLARPQSTREWEGGSRAYLEIYRRVRMLNTELGAARRIRIVALDAPGWPPTPPPSPARLAQQYGERAEHMARVLEQRILDRDDRARVLVFVDGLHALRARARIETGGATLDSVPMLAARIESGLTGGLFTVLIGSTAPPAPGLGLAGYRPGTFFDQMAAASTGNTPWAIELTPDYRFSERDIEIWRAPGVSLELTGTGGPRPLVDAWVRLPG